MNIDLEKIIDLAMQRKMSIYIAEDAVSITPWGGAAPEEPKPEPKPAPDPTKKKDIDMGKVKALRKAGWAYAKIADEMGVSTQTIVNRLKEG